MPVQARYGRRGAPDFLCCVPVTITAEMVGQRIGVFTAIEAKSSVGVLSAHQAGFISEFESAGARVLLARANAKTKEEVIAWLGDIFPGEGF